MKLGFVFTALGLLVATPAYATVTLTYSGTANIDIDGVTQVNANVAWTISFDESGVSDNDVDNNDGDFNDVPITDMRVLVNGTTYIIDIGTTDANLDISSIGQYDLLLLTWIGGSPLMDGRARFYTATGGLESNGFFGDIDEFDSAQSGASGGNDNTSSHDSSIAFSASRPLITTTGEQLVMDHDFPNGTETMQLAIGEVEPQAATFIGLGDLPGGDFRSYGENGSSDGSTVVGLGSSAASGYEAFRWTQSGGMVGLGFLPFGSFSRAYGVSADGSIVVGHSGSGSLSEAFRWTQAGGMVGLGDLPGGDFYSIAYHVSADGSTVVGQGGSASTVAEAFLWTQSGGMVGLGVLPFGSHSWAYGVSADGSTVLGSSRTPSSGAQPGGDEAFLWTQSGGMVGLGDLAGGIFESGARRISTDGSTVVGVGSSASGYEAFRWTQSGGMVGLGDLPGGTFDSWGADVSADGSIVVGRSNSALGEEAFVWNETDGMQSLKQVLIDQGVDMTGWTLSRARGVSDDGLTIVGWGTNPSGDLEAWIATLSASSPPPVPSLGPAGMSVLASLLLCIGLGNRNFYPH
jgi:probable HAF family extracellular repeat protein